MLIGLGVLAMISGCGGSSDSAGPPTYIVPTSTVGAVTIESATVAPVPAATTAAMAPPTTTVATLTTVDPKYLATAAPPPTPATTTTVAVSAETAHVDLLTPSVDPSYKVFEQDGVVYGSGETADGDPMDLLLNLCLPRTEERGLRPLMVWIHGGGFLEKGDARLAPKTRHAVGLSHRSTIAWLRTVL